MSDARELPVATELDVADAARLARELALDQGLGATVAQQVATAVSEVAMNAVKYAHRGRIRLVAVTAEGRRGVRVDVRDQGPGIADPASAMREGGSSGGTLGLGLPAARRLMDDFTLETGAAGTVVRMARWAHLVGSGRDSVAWALRAAPGAVPLGARIRNGVLLGVVAGARADEAARLWRAAPWRGPARLAEDARRRLAAGERLGVALAAHSALDGRLEWLAAGDACAALVRDGAVLAAEPLPALAAEGGVARGAVVDLRRDDVLVLAAAQLTDAEVVALAVRAPGHGSGVEAVAPGDGPAWTLARFARGALEPTRPAPAPDPDRRV